MALTDREKSIYNQVRQQKGTHEQAVQTVREYRDWQKKQGKLEIKGAGIVAKEKPAELTEEQKQKQLVQQDPNLTNKQKLKQISKIDEQDEWLKGFIKEAPEALGRRKDNLADIKQRFDEKNIKGSQAIAEAWQEKWAWPAFWESIKKSANQLGSSWQVVWQLAGWTTDVVWEGLENFIQDATPDTVEDKIDAGMKAIWDSKLVQEIAESYGNWRENNPEKARNIEATINIASLIPAVKGWQIVKKGITNVAKGTARETAKKQVRNVWRSFLNLPAKTKPARELDLSRFFFKKVKPTEFLDDVVDQFDDIGTKAINTVDSELAKVTTKFKPQGAKEVLKAIDKNLKNIEFTTAQKKAVKDLLKKFDGDGLTLSELNKIKRSISDYTKAWTQAWKEWAWLNPAAMRGKYTEIRKFIENTARKNKLKDIKDLNQEWINADELVELLGKQATSVGKKQWLELMQQRGFVGALGKKILEWRRKLGLTDLNTMDTLADLDLIKALKLGKDFARQSEKIGLWESTLKALWTGAKELKEWTKLRLLKWIENKTSNKKKNK